uniref:Uncharacterized protein n=1 Tax=Ditylenchus dipsaci TaxID=166011 RepID=A0A915CVU6_9BILA
MHDSDVSTDGIGSGQQWCRLADSTGMKARILNFSMKNWILLNEQTLPAAVLLQPLRCTNMKTSRCDQPRMIKMEINQDFVNFPPYLDSP